MSCGEIGIFETKEAGNEHWLENGKEMQAKFDEIVTCNSPGMIATCY